MQPLEVSNAPAPPLAQVKSVESGEEDLARLSDTASETSTRSSISNSTKTTTTDTTSTNIEADTHDMHAVTSPTMKATTVAESTSAGNTMFNIATWKSRAVQAKNTMAKKYQEASAQAAQHYQEATVVISQKAQVVSEKANKTTASVAQGMAGASKNVSNAWRNGNQEKSTSSAAENDSNDVKSTTYSFGKIKSSMWNKAHRFSTKSSGGRAKDENETTTASVGANAGAAATAFFSTGLTKLQAASDSLKKTGTRAFSKSEPAAPSTDVASGNDNTTTEKTDERSAQSIPGRYSQAMKSVSTWFKT